MQCPACDHELGPLDVGGVQLDACHGKCGGVWFDNFEIEKFDEKHEDAGNLMDIAVDKSVKIKDRAKRVCPRCTNIKMQRHFFSAKRAIEVDECAGCGGHWLDADELRRIRDEFNTAQDREDAALASFGESFDGELAEMRTQSQKEVQRAKSFANMFRVICPSYWIAGKQDGAAF